jgi:hypothetical protein
VYAYEGNRPQDTATKSAVWSVGDPGPPALVFPSPDLADRSSLGILRVALPTNSTAIYAQSVTVPGVNHAARLGAFVTDRMCNPVDGATLTYALTPAGAATVNPSTVTLVQGVPAVEAVLQAGAEAVNDGMVTGTVRGSGSETATGRTSFQIIGPADRLNIIVNPKTLNLLNPATQRAGIGVQVRDANGRNVANGTRVRVRIPDSDPGLLAHDRAMLVDGHIVRDTVVLGKAAELVTLDGYGQVPQSEDPAVQNGTLYLKPDRVGDVTISAEADGKTVTTNTPTGQKTIHIISYDEVLLPLLIHKVWSDQILPPRARH